MDQKIADTYRVFYNKNNKKFRDTLANYYMSLMEDSSNSLNRKFAFLKQMDHLDTKFSVVISKYNNVIINILDKYNVYYNPIKHENEIDIDFTEEDFHWL